MWDVAIDPTNPATIWIGLWDQFGLNSRTLWRSDDGGISWVDRTPPLSGTISCHEIVLDPTNTSRVFACFTADNFVHLGLGEVWFSPDGGTTWFDRTSNLPDGPKRDLHYDGNRILVAGDGLDDHIGPLLEAIGLYESTDDGQTWTALHDASWPTLRVLEIDVDPADPDRILVGTRGHGVHRSIDGGATWQTSVDGTVGSSISALHVAAGNGNRILAGAVGPGALLSEDAGLSFDIAAQGMDIVLVRSVAVNPLDSTQIAAAISYQTGGVIASSVNSGLDWAIEPIANTSFSKVAFAPDGLLYALSVGPLSVGTDGIYRREQNGTWTHVGLEGVPGGLTAIRFSNNDPNLILAGGGFELALGVNETDAVTIWRSTNGGATWTREFEESRFRETITRIEFVEDGTDNVVLATAGSLQPGALGAMLRSVDGGRTWAESRTGLPLNMQAFGLSASTADPQIFYLADLGSDGFGPEGSIYKSVDAGQSWFDTGFGAAAPGSDGGAIDVLCDPVDPNVIYAIKLANIPPFPPPGTAAWISDDAGASYRSFSEGAIPAPPVFLFELAFADGASDQVLCATGAGLRARTVREAIPGDLNCDGAFNGGDIDPFFLALGDPAAYALAFPSCNILLGDMNGDGRVNGADIDPFFDCLAGGPCP
ncbi:MAG: hypothetical protein IH986_16875 [Planctomycetes bacterium]|nr:hypothetical protein [Planctomycetota bacterium]